ncbi:reticulophagy regulator 1 [Pungitius pungitius]|uniref:reticulophagy regulator 1 n=1 Tax=Pungitius pungitius TaxID=134920 RepID=UPI002E12822D
MSGSRETGTAGCQEAAAGPPGPPSRADRRQETAAGGAGCRPPGLVNWRQRPCRTSALFAAANAVLWFGAFSSFRACSLLAAILALLVVTVTARDIARSRSTGAHLWCSMTASWEIIDSGRVSPSGTGPQLGDSLKLFLQETSAFKQQNPGKFCLLVCSLCTFFAVLGRYIPGIVISYVLVLSVFLWPLISSHEVGLWLEPVLQKLDFGIGEFLHRIKENHENRIRRSETENEGVESDLSSMFPKLDSTVCKEMSVSDTEASDVTWTDNGTFNLSEGHTPQTENSEDLDREEAFTGGLPEFPSLDNGATTNGDEDDEDDFSLGLSSPPPRAASKSKHAPPPHGGLPNAAALQLVNQMAGDFIAAAVTAAMQERIEAAVGLAEAPPRLPDAARLLEAAEESDSEVEDFELLDQSELEQLGGALGLGEAKAEGGARAGSGEPASTGFFSKLLRRH